VAIRNPCGRHNSEIGTGNHHTSRPEGLPETFEQLAEHYRLIELNLEKESERKVPQTKQTYAIYLANHYCGGSLRDAVACLGQAESGEGHQ
jgi:hypothetical protein